MLPAAQTPAADLYFRVPDEAVLSRFHIGDRLGVAIGGTPLVCGGGRVLGHLAGQLVAVRHLRLNQPGRGDRLL